MNLNRFNKSNFTQNCFLLICLISILSVSSCVTTKKIAPPLLPTAFQTAFSSCAHNDGFSVIRIYEGDRFLGSSEADWKAKKTGHIDILLRDQLGRTLLKAKIEDSSVKTAGLLAFKLPPIGVRDDGFLEVDSNFIGIKSSELACMMGLKFPQTWLNHLRSFTKTNSDTILVAKDDERVITIRFSKISDMKPAVKCAQIEWSHFLGLMSSKINWCIKSGSTDYAEISMPNNYRMKWIKIDDD